MKMDISFHLFIFTMGIWVGLVMGLSIAAYLVRKR